MEFFVHELAARKQLLFPDFEQVLAKDFGGALIKGHAFIRTISGLIARATLGTERGKAKGLKFWDALPFSRILECGKDYRQACAYLRRNVLEARGFITYRSRHMNAGRAKGKPPD